jgi:cold-inducible RNA-binding protein
MSIKLYVGNLSFDTTEEQLTTLFSEAGNVTSAKIITDRHTGQPRGFGFVEMETKSAGQRAISMLNGRTVDGRPLSVNEAKPQQKSGGGGFGGGGRRGGGGGGGGGYR